MAQPRDPNRNVLIYDKDGSLLADLQVNTDRTKQYLTHEMLRRYCSWILKFPELRPWQIVPLRSNGRPGRRTYDRHVQPGNYFVVAEDLTPLTVQLTDAVAPRRVRTRDTDSSTQGQNQGAHLQRTFRDKIRARDSVCAVTGRAPFTSGDGNQYLGLQPAHIFPTSRITEWNRDNYRRWVDTTRPASEIGDTGIYSPQNGLLLSSEVHSAFDEFLFGVDPDADYKLILFGRDPNEVGGTPLRDSARFGTAQNNHVSPELLRWHLKMCVYWNFKASAEPQMPWEDDLVEDDIGEILEQPDAAERMEVELYTRLGELIG